MARNTLEKSNKPVGRLVNFWHLLTFAFAALRAKTGTSYFVMAGLTREQGPVEDGTGVNVELGCHGYTAGSPKTLTLMLRQLMENHKRNLIESGFPPQIAALMCEGAFVSRPDGEDGPRVITVSGDQLPPEVRAALDSLMERMTDKKPDKPTTH